MTSARLPKEILNPLKAARQYGLSLYPAAGRLAAFVDEYWVLRWDRRDQPAFMCEVIPSPYINVTFMSEGPRLTGVTTGKYTFDLTGQGLIVGVKFRPGGFYPFWGQPVSTLTDDVRPADTVFPELTPAFNQSVLTARDDGRALALVETWLTTRRPAPDAAVDQIGRIIALIDTEDGLTVRAVAQRMGLRERALQALFRTYVGVGVKWNILRARLQKAAARAIGSDAPNWTEIAAELGYSDQAHFINDFKRIIGHPPSEYAARAKG